MLYKKDQSGLQKNDSSSLARKRFDGILSRGKTSMCFVQSGAKINVDYYVNHISKLVIFIVYFQSMKKMIYHHDSALSHTIAFLNKSKINYVKPEEWMPKSDPMDYAIWCYFK